MTSPQRIRPGIVAVNAAVAQFFVEYPQFAGIDLSIALSRTGAHFGLDDEAMVDPIAFIKAMARAFHGEVHSTRFHSIDGTWKVSLTTSGVFDGVKLHAAAFAPAPIGSAPVRELVAA